MSIEIIGYLGTAFVLTSFMMSDIKKLRTVNIIGGLLWIVYGIIVGSSSIIVGNVLIVLIQGYKLYKLATKREKYYDVFNRF